MAKDHVQNFDQDRPYVHALPTEEAQDADYLVQLAKLEPLTDGGLRTARFLSDALELDPANHDAQLLRERLYQVMVPRWHFPMLGDEVRNRTYAEAIAAKVRPGDIVLDIGCGAGLTAMLAARAGAKHVYTCEQQPLIAEAAKQVIAANGLSDRITVIPKMSHNLVIGQDLPEPADVVVSEIVDNVLLGEGALATLTHAMHMLAKPDARAIPERGRLFAQLVESDRLWHLWRPRRPEGFDVAPFHDFASVAHVTPNDLATLGLRPLGRPVELFDFDFARPDTRSARATQVLSSSTWGTIHAVMVYFEMDLAPGLQLTNNLLSEGHWGRTVFLSDQPARARPGTHLQVTAQHDTSQLTLTLHDDHAVTEDSSIWTDLDDVSDIELGEDFVPLTHHAPVGPMPEAPYH